MQYSPLITRIGISLTPLQNLLTSDFVGVQGIIRRRRFPRHSIATDVYCCGWPRLASASLEAVLVVSCSDYSARCQMFIIVGYDVMNLLYFFQVSPTFFLFLFFPPTFFSLSLFYALPTVFFSFLLSFSPTFFLSLFYALPTVFFSPSFYFLFRVCSKLHVKCSPSNLSGERKSYISIYICKGLKSGHGPLHLEYECVTDFADFTKPVQKIMNIETN